MQVKLHFLHLDASWVLTLTNQDQSSQESVLCTKCSISYIISHQPVNRVYWETSWFSAIYAGKIAFFTFGHFVGSNFEKPRTSQESVLCMKCSISYIISHQPVNRVYWETSWFSAIYAGKIAFFTFGHFVGSNFEKPRTSQESVLCMKCSILYIISHRPVKGFTERLLHFQSFMQVKLHFLHLDTSWVLTLKNQEPVKSPFYVWNAAFCT